MTEPISGVVMLGSGGHARALQELLAEQNTTLVGYVSPTSANSSLADTIWLGSDDMLRELDPKLIQLVNGIGSTSTVILRRTVFQAAMRWGYSFRNVVDEAASVRRSAVLGIGVQILPGAIIGSDVVLGDDVLVNSGAIIEHGSRVGPHSHISPGAVLSGAVTVGDSSHVGLGAKVIQGVSIGSNCTIGAGAVVIRDVPDGSLAMGVPAVSRQFGRDSGGNGHVDD